MEINGLPLHALVTHAAVVFIPFASLVSIVYALVPKWRWATRWVSVVSALAALGAVLLTYFSGKDLLEHREELQTSTVISLHQERAQVLLWVTIVFVFVVLLGAWALGGPSALASGWGARAKHAPLIEWSVVTMLVILAVFCFLMTIQTAEAGANSRWADSAPAARSQL